jgi:hypothetical protein
VGDSNLDIEDIASILHVLINCKLKLKTQKSTCADGIAAKWLQPCQMVASVPTTLPPAQVYAEIFQAHFLARNIQYGRAEGGCADGIDVDGR